jgi:uncharacterized membrane protein YjgN (DUF898 family)
MVVFSMRCPKCGLIQMQAPSCKSCGRVIDGSAPAPAATPPTFRPKPAAPGATTPSTSTAEEAPLPARPARLGADDWNTRRLTFHGTGGSLFGILVVNLFLTLVTLGVYSFWGRVRVRQYLLGQTQFEGDRFAYHGTGMELFLGFLKALPIFAALILLQFLPGLLRLGEATALGINVLTVILFFLLVPFIIVAAFRYRLSRTSWRGIRFSFRGQVFEFMKLFVSGFLLSLITLGIYYPIFATKQYGFLVSHAHLGNHKFEFDGRGRDLMRGYLLALLLTLPTLGLYWLWFSANMMRYLASHTTFTTARFQSTMTGGRLLVFYATNLLLLLVTFGLAFPWITVRAVRFFFGHLTIEGPLDLVAIQQDAKLASATGEGLAGLLDVDLDLGV